LTILSRRAEQHFRALVLYYERLGRHDAIRNLRHAVAEAAELIDADPHSGLPAPRPYPDLANPRRLWRKVGRYWFAYRPATTDPPVIISIFYEAADIPHRL
jgi:plasmid stabilization system protein ParE